MAPKSPEARIKARPASPGTCIIEIGGEFTAFAEDKLMTAYVDACRNGVSSIVLDFDGLNYMSSSGIGLLVTLLIRAQRQQQRLLAYGLSEHYRHIFELTRLNEAITVHGDQAAALAAAGSVRA
ncbi:MAG: STAS domain-containing protein [Anaerolineae bacterium]